MGNLVELMKANTTKRNGNESYDATSVAFNMSMSTHYTLNT